VPWDNTVLHYIMPIGVITWVIATAHRWAAAARR
jgi:hypothetical protein